MNDECLFGIIYNIFDHICIQS